ncbi:hypothetical protein SLEP1_g40388 [Rubroshorea leprosula]|uniref:Uncharacterized protein n=1 Tax=Rubroshorea leprosula TaxID=152421 RepID=A0AAV5L445_9ROSI|nr:hypothetical protein SLEP1_g40388 [Rubroshorea leprosula]
MSGWFQFCGEPVSSLSSIGSQPQTASEADLTYFSSLKASPATVGGKASLQPKRTPVSSDEIEAILFASEVKNPALPSCYPTGAFVSSAGTADDSCSMFLLISWCVNPFLHYGVFCLHDPRRVELGIKSQETAVWILRRKDDLHRRFCPMIWDLKRGP